MSKEQIKSITFNIEPEVRIRVINDSDPVPVKKSKVEYPFELNNTLTVYIVTSKREFQFNIYNGYTWNGADIPRMFWRIIGSRTDNDFLIASMLHDYMLEFKSYIIHEVLGNQISMKEYRRLTSLVFREKIKAQGTNTIKANIMAWCVDVFQMCNIRSWKCP